MRFLIVGFFLVFLLTSCKQDVKESSLEEMLEKIISSKSEIKQALISKFDINVTFNTKLFKLFISRRDRFVRLTIYQILNVNDIDDLPAGYFYYHNHLFIFFDGSEILFNKKLSRKELNSLISTSEIKLDTSMYSIHEGPVAQFDIDLIGRIKDNDPAINPYDLTEIPADPRWKNQGRKDSL